MEKIYMENNNNNKKQSKVMQILTSKLSNTLSISMILVAFASFLAMGFSGNQSYAMVEGTVPEEFVVDSNPTVIKSQALSNLNVDTMHVTSINQRVFCLESDLNFPTHSSGVEYTYKKSNEVVDSGVTYILKNSWNNTDNITKDFKVTNGTQASNNSVTVTDDVKKTVVGTWVTQMAVWNHMLNIGSSNMTNFSKVSTTIKGINDIHIMDGVNNLGTHFISTNPFYTDYIQSLLEGANNYKGKSVHMSIARENNDISVTDDNKYYQTSLITVSGNTVFADDTYNGYSLTLNNAPKDTLVIGEDGNEIKDLSNMPTNKFYLRIPVNGVTNDNKKMSISVKGNFDHFVGIKYYPHTADGTKVANVQSVVLLAKINEDISGGSEIDLTYTPNVPDTGMSSAQSIYFIGLVILLCGVGIIYANTKQKQEQ